MTVAARVADAAAVRERPIPFSAPMVSAILADAKTKTRRVVTSANSLVNGLPPCMKRDPDILGAWCTLDFSNAFVDPGPSPAGNAGPYLKVASADDSRHRVYPRIWTGDRLWVREAWRTYSSLDHLPPRSIARGAGIQYECGGSNVAGAPTLSGMGRLRPGMFMPRWASRLTLEVTDVRVERLQDISDEDIAAEGVAPYVGEMRVNGERASGFMSAQRYFAALWNSINANRPGCSWRENPWVWAVSFRRLTP